MKFKAYFYICKFCIIYKYKYKYKFLYYDFKKITKKQYQRMFKIINFKY